MFLDYSNDVARPQTRLVEINIRSDFVRFNLQSIDPLNTNSSTISVSI